MPPTRITLLALVGALLMAPAMGSAQEQRPAGKTYLLAFGRGLAVDPPAMQRLGRESVLGVIEAARTTAAALEVEALTEELLTPTRVRSGEARPRLSGRLLRERLTALARTVGPEDTVVIYTHTHGRRAGFEAAQPLGGLVLDLPALEPAHRGTTLWSDYAEWFLALPARTVIVAVMSCFSGGLIDYLERPDVRPRWAGWGAEGRSLVVLTSQSSALPSNPIVKDGVRINPFTYAFSSMLRGEADGFSLRGGRPAPGPRDGRLTIGELVDFVLHVTARVESEVGENDAQPQVGGCFDRARVLGFGSAPPR